MNENTTNNVTYVQTICLSRPAFSQNYEIVVEMLLILYCMSHIVWKTAFKGVA